MKSLVSLSDLGVTFYEDLFDLMRWTTIGLNTETAKREPALIAMFEPSTRTEHTFHLALTHLGMEPLHFKEAGSSMEKGEDIARTLDAFVAMGCKTLIIRTPRAFEPYALDCFYDCSIINAGDGSNAHPTQALTDLYTASKHFGGLAGLAGLKVVIMGDILHSRVAHSDAWAFRTAGCEVIGTGPTEWLPVDDFEDYGFDSITNWPERALSNADIVITLRPQAERHDLGQHRVKDVYLSKWGLTKERHEFMTNNAFIMAPGPVSVGTEMDHFVYNLERCLVKQQVTNSITVRASLIWALRTGRLNHVSSVRGVKWG